MKSPFLGRRVIASLKGVKYQKVFKDWESEGTIEEVYEEEIQDERYYLSHKGVFKEDSNTAVRPVVDTLCRLRGKPSLNDWDPTCWKAFLYCHNRVVFGVSCNPFLLGAVLDRHLMNSLCYPEMVEMLRLSLYVDNYITSVNTEEKLHQFIDESRMILLQAKFDLRVSEYTKSNLGEMTSVLGLTWNLVVHVLLCKIVDVQRFGENIARRSVLLNAHSIFDPLGSTCPIYIALKILLQES
ncbi:hypothetical protein PR048_005937 [Dryococelus australis]|uniref:Reverse transcriptase domain-containing protein n=1 Tax=Dryococelus australis TaxID=614101 RepID=A0ABQ9IAJ5_9NEOP|nr:hypothetical protein PR048_005937 [Dryococelus australis]